MRDVLAAALQLRSHRLLVTMAYGPAFVVHIPRWLGRAAALGVPATVLFCLDAAAHDACRAASAAWPLGAVGCVRGTPSILNKFTLPLVLLDLGYEVFWVDFDVFLFADPWPALDAAVAETKADLLLSESFAAACICSGVVLFRPTEPVVTWLRELLVWMYEHPYEHDQKAVSAFLLAGERVAPQYELPVLHGVAIPEWAVLDGGNQFVSARHVDVAGWTGQAEDVVVFHFLNGESDDAHASRDFIRTGPGEKRYRNLLAEFYGHPEDRLFGEGPPLSPADVPELRALLDLSRWDARPEDRPRCNQTVPMNS